jgi:uncharacterized protein YjcR
MPKIKTNTGGGDYVTKIEQAEQDYKSGLKYKEIAEKYGVSLNTVKSWKTRYSWQKVCTQKQKGVHTKKCAPPPGNHNAVTHGLFAKYLPPETLQIAKELTEASPIDILWGNICIKYAAILRAQKIMYVDDKDDLTKVLKRQKIGDKSWEEEFELQFAWDKQATFLKAQSTAMTALTNMLKQYEELCRSEMATEEQRLRVDKLKAEVEVLKGENDCESVNLIDDLSGEK